MSILNRTVFSFSKLACAAIASGVLISSGCQQQTMTDAATSFEPNYVYAKVISVRGEIETDKYLKDINRLTEEWFGTPDEPKLPPSFAEDDDLKDLLSLDNLKMAAGPAPATSAPGETGLFRQQCATCHGETGQGRGVVAASQNPYPRDFRKGLYKYKTTSRNGKPTKADLQRVLVHGLEGTQMPKFDKLSEKQLNAIIDYVIYLSIRGEFERQLLGLTMDLDPGVPLYDKSAIGSVIPSDDKDKESYTDETYNEQLKEAADELADIAMSWVDAEDDVEEADEPENTFVTGITSDDADSAALAASIERGKALFANQTAACSKCHGEAGNGLGPQVPDYDDWTKEWTQQINVDPKSKDEVLPFLVIGALPPQPLAPRNLVEGKLRGGRDPQAIYHRIRYGIAGSPMPAATLKQGEQGLGLSNDDVWDLVNYVLSLKAEPTNGDAPKVAAQ